MTNEVKVKLTVEEQQALRALTSLTKKTKSFGDQAAKSSKKAADSFSVFSGVLGSAVVIRAFDFIKTGLADAFRGVKEFDTAVREINTLLPKNAKLTANITDELVDLSSEFGTSKQKQAKAFYQIISSGAAEGAEATKLLASANKLALGGLADLTDVVNVLTDATNVYGAETLSSEDAADSLFTTVRLGKTNISELSSSLGQVLPLSQRLGVSFDEVGAALATMTTQGLTTNQRITQLNGLFTAVLKKGGEAEKLFGKDVAKAFNITALRTKGLNKFLQDLIVATGGSEEVLVKLLGRAEAAQAVFALTGNATATFTDNIDEYTRKAGAATAASEELSNSLEIQFDKASAKLDNFIGKIINGLAPALIEPIKLFNDLTDAFAKVDGVLSAISSFGEKVAGGDIFTKRFDSLGAKELGAELKKVEGFLAEARAREGNFSFRVDLADAEELELRIAKIKERINATAAEGIISPGGNLEIDRIIEDFQRKEDQLFMISEREGNRRDIERLENEKRAEAALTAMKAGEATKRQELLNAIDEQDRLNKEQIELEAIIAREEATESDLARLQETKKKQNAIIKDFDSQETAIITKGAKDRATARSKAAADAKKKEGKALKSLFDFEKNTNAGRAANFKSTLGTISTLSSSSNKELFVIGKAAAVGNATIDGIAAVQKALASAPPPFNFALAALVGVATAANIAKIASQKPPSFQDGGFVPGNQFSGDNVLARVNSDEFIANRAQQRNILSAVANGQGGGDNMGALVDSINNLASRVNVIEINGREIARTVREERLAGVAI